MDTQTHPPYNRARTKTKREVVDQIKVLKTKTPQSAMAKNFYQYTGPDGQTLHGYERQYKGKNFGKRDFFLSGTPKRI
jgi:hypothetical protein